MTQTRLPIDSDVPVDEEDNMLREGEYKYATPLEVVRPISEAVGGFDLDPCASETSSLATHNIRGEGGLAYDWGQHQTVWCNHPFGRGEPERWLREAVECDAETVVTLSKCDPSTQWFHDYALEADLLCFPAERISFVGYPNGLDSPVMLAVFGTVTSALRDHFEETGWVTIPEKIGQQAGSPTLTGVCRADAIRVRFDGSLSLNGFETDTATLKPLCRRFPGEDVVEVTAVSCHDEREIWWTLSQSVDGGQIICRRHKRESGFTHVFIDRVAVPTEMRTPEPSSHMHVA